MTINSLRELIPELQQRDNNLLEIDELVFAENDFLQNAYHRIKNSENRTNKLGSQAFVALQLSASDRTAQVQPLLASVKSRCRCRCRSVCCASKGSDGRRKRGGR